MEIKRYLVDRHRFNADPDPDSYFHVYTDLHPDPDLPDPDCIKTVLILMRILLQVLHMLETRNSLLWWAGSLNIDFPLLGT
jgi:hypothetical protein